MRTVVVHLRNATQALIEDFLARTYTRQKGPPWICDVDGDPCLYIHIYRDMELEFEPEEIAQLRDELGGEPTVSIAADVSGRHEGGKQVREFVFKLLTEFEGLAEDEYTKGFWTLDEVMSKSKKRDRASGRERTFFDYRQP